MSTNKGPGLGSPLSVRNFRRSLRALEREVELSLLSQTECCGVTNAQCHILLELEARGNTSVGELAEALELDPSTMSRTADSLVRAGLVSRVDDPANRRRQLLDLTSSGKEKADYINEVCDEYYSAVLAGADKKRGNALADDLAYLATAIRTQRLKGVSCCPQSKKAEEE
jgi:DNA-binding MarR family transcriptional regulator